MKEKNDKKFGGKKEIAIVNSVTALRCLASFLVIPVFKVLGGLNAAIFSGIFLLTDFIDGFLARKLKSSTFFGAIFDGLTDKAFGILAYATLMTINPIIFSIPLLLEVAITIVQNIKLKNGQNVKSNMIGKIKTWFLGLSIVGSFTAIDLANIPPLLDYIKYSSLDKVANIKDFLILLGIQLPTIVTQLLTLSSYGSEAKNIDEELNQEDTILDTEKLEIESELDIKLQEIEEKRDLLQSKLSLLEKIKILKDALFDPEYYSQNKDMPVRTLTKELFKEK